MNSGNWQDYERTVGIILDKLHDVKNQLGLSKIEGKQQLQGKSGTIWEIDAVAYDSRTGKPVIVECKHWRDKTIPQDVLASLAYKIRDIGGERGIVVFTQDLQPGAKKIAESENIEIIKLNYEATGDRFDLVLPKYGKSHLGLVGKVRIVDKIERIE